MGIRAGAGSAEHYRLLAENASDVAAVWSMLDPHLLLQAVLGADGQPADLMVVDANEAACHALERERDRLVGARLGEMEGPSGSWELFVGCMETMRSGRPVILDDEPFRPAGSPSERRFAVRMVRFDVDRMTVSWRDVTERHTGAPALASAEARFHIAMDSATIGMCLVSPMGAFLQVNPPLCDMLGRDPSTLRATTWQPIGGDPDPYTSLRTAGRRGVLRPRWAQAGQRRARARGRQPAAHHHGAADPIRGEIN